MQKRILLITFLNATSGIHCSDLATSPPVPSTSSPNPSESKSDLPEATVGFEAFAPLSRPANRPLDRMPKAITVTFAEPLSPKDRTNEGSVIYLEPGEVGFLTWISPQTLKIVPVDVFPPASVIRLRIGALHTRLGLMRGTIEHNFTTPSFALQQARVAKINTQANQSHLELIFSGPVAETNDIQSRLTLETNGRKLPIQSIDIPPETPHIARVALKGKWSKAEEIRVQLAEGVQMAGRDTTAPSAEFQLPLPATPVQTVRILDAELRESIDGWYLQVVCTDDSYSGPFKSNYPTHGVQDTYPISARCILDDSALKNGVEVRPFVPLRIAGTQGGFRLLGSFPRGPLELTIPAGVRTVDGGVVASSFTKTFDIRQRTPTLTFLSHGRYAPVDQLNHVPLRVLNVEKATVQVRRVRPGALIFWASGAEEQTTPRTADLIKESTLTFDSPVDQPKIHTLDASNFLPEHTTGLFEITVASAKESVPQPQATLRLIASRIDLVAKRTPNLVHVWAFDKHTLTPRSGITVQLVQPSGQVRSEGVTGRNGECILDYRGEDFTAPDPTPPFGLLASTPTDLTYLAFDEVETPLADADTSGVPPHEPPTHTASIWSDRGIYHLGETIHFLVTVWDHEMQEPPTAGLPIELSLTDPRGIEIAKTTSPTSPMGVVPFDYHLAEFAETGNYRLQVRVRGHTVNTWSVLVRPYQPERMRVVTTSTKTSYYGSEYPEFNLKAEWLFGGIPRHHRVSLHCHIEPINPKFSAFLRYHFGQFTERSTSTGNWLSPVTGSLDNKGEISLHCPLDELPSGINYPSRITGTLTLTEDNQGPSVTRKVHTTYFPSDKFIGLRTQTTIASAGKPLTVEGVIVDAEGHPVHQADQITIKLFRAESEQAWQFDNHTGDWSQGPRVRLSEDNSLQTPVKNGKFRTSITPTVPSSHYVLRATKSSTTGHPTSNSELTIRGEKTIQNHYPPLIRTAGLTSEPVAPEKLVLNVPKSIHRGTAAKVTLEVPFPGRVLFTVETDNLLSTEWRDVPQPGTLSFGVHVERHLPHPDQPLPNIYVSALAVQDPHAASVDSFIPARGFGVASINVESKSPIFPMKLSSPKTASSGSALTIKLAAPTAPPNTEIYIAAVDEHLLQQTQHAPPNPLHNLFPKQALEVKTYDTVGWNLNLPPPPIDEQTGGGKAVRRRASRSVSAPISLWSGMLTIDEEGRTSVPFKIPNNYQGTLRIMAVGFGPGSVGQAERTIEVSNPVILVPQTPAVLTVGDEFEFPVRVMNKSKTPQVMLVQLQAPQQEGVSITPDSQTATVSPSAEQLLWFKVKADHYPARQVDLKTRAWAPQTATSTITALHPTASTTIAVDSTIRLRPIQALKHTTQIYPLTPGSMDLSKAIGPWLKNTGQTSIKLTRHSFAEVTHSLNELLRNSFEGLEPTVSRLRGLLVSNLFTEVKPKPHRQAGIREGINRLAHMQLENGAFSFWTGTSVPHPWASAYTIDLWLDLEHAGYAIPPHLLHQALAWAHDYVQQAPLQPATPYLHYVLAKAKQPQHDAIQKSLTALKDGASSMHPGQVREARFLLRAAQYLGGDRRVRAALIKFAENRVAHHPSHRAGLYSEHRRRGLELAILAELFGSPEWLRTPIHDLASRLNPTVHYTTQENAWSLTAIARFMGPTVSRPPALPTTTLIVDGLPRAPEHADPLQNPEWSLDDASSIQLNVGTEKELSGHVVIQSEGIDSEAPATAISNGLMVERTLVDRTGDAIDRHAVRLGELIYAKLTLTSVRAGDLSYVALTNPVPAGFVILPFESHTTHPSEVPTADLWQPEHMQLWDDRVEAFGQLQSKTSRVFYIPLRAVTAGTYAHPAANLEAMYHPRKWAQATGQPVTIVR
ncbi:MAG: hypothetical protein KTR25_00155 [Myxococcales bacterium]|nr:hypothetical protein [Myxococcales bacterium]